MFLEGLLEFFTLHILEQDFLLNKIELNSQNILIFFKMMKHLMLQKIIVLLKKPTDNIVGCIMTPEIYTCKKDQSKDRGAIMSAIGTLILKSNHISQCILHIHFYTENLLFFILYIHFYKIPTSVHLFYHLFYLNNQFSQFFLLFLSTNSFTYARSLSLSLSLPIFSDLLLSLYTHLSTHLYTNF